jgi:hypothetical protein
MGQLLSLSCKTLCIQPPHVLCRRTGTGRLLFLLMKVLMLPASTSTQPRCFELTLLSACPCRRDLQTLSSSILQPHSIAQGCSRRLLCRFAQMRCAHRTVTVPRPSFSFSRFMESSLFERILPFILSVPLLQESMASLFSICGCHGLFCGVFRY